MYILNFIMGLDPLAIIFLVAGIALVIFEMFHPGLSAPGILGCIFLIVGVVLSVKRLMDALILIIIIIAILGIALTLALHSVTKGHLSEVLVLSEISRKESESKVLDDLLYFVGKECVTLTPLRPSGIADFNGVRLDVISEGEFIDKDKKVQVVKVDGKKIVVKEVKRVYKIEEEMEEI